jgi:prephenate dehydrogenase
VIPRRIAIIGPGLIGASVALAARRAWPDVHITELDRGASLDQASAADLTVLATPVDIIIKILRQESALLHSRLVIDTGSTKRTIVAAAREAKLDAFVGGHPMAGAASSGPRDARADLFDDKAWFLIPANATRSALELAHAFVEALGARPVPMHDDGSEHDRLMAVVSHLPQVVASVLMTVAGDAAGEPGLQWAGSGLRDTTRLAASESSMWASILATNAGELRPLLQQCGDRLRAIAEHIDDPDEVRRLFDTANRYRDILK